MMFMPENVSSFGSEIDSLAILITILVGVCLFVVLAIFFYSLVKFRRQSGEKANYILGNSWHQVKWVIVPVLIIIVMDFYIDFRTTDAWEKIKGSTPKGDIVVRVTAQQFSWLFTYPDNNGRFESKGELKKINDFHVPVNKTIVFHLESKDVLHSFWVPSLRLKQDVVPGRTITGWFVANKIGQYEIACAEICGVGHTVMSGTLIVESQEDYDRWRNNPDLPDENNLSLGTATKGMQLVKIKGCLACHSVDGAKVVGPSYKGIFGRKTVVLTGGKEHEIIADEAYIRRSILEPNVDIVKGYQPLMPPQRGGLTEGEVDAIVE